MLHLDRILSSLEEADMLNELHNVIKNNLNPKFKIRPYQLRALRRFITYFENDKLKTNPTQLLFHMATGSGKTLIMAGSIIYLYTKGYRNFLFFVNSNNIIDKTKDNFLNVRSSKYLFNEKLNINGNNVRINLVDNFQFKDDNSINICFTTIQGLHGALNLPSENSISFDDFYDKKIVLLSDEAHHINATTRNGKTKGEDTWEASIDRVLGANKNNVMLEFTATIDIDTNESIRSKYDNKLVFNYDLRKFREDGYSKEVKILQSNLESFERALVAIVISQYRMKLFNKYNYNIKPIVLFKSKTIKESLDFEKEFHSRLNKLNTNDLLAIFNSIDNSKENFIITKVKNYLESENIQLDNFLLELKEDFNINHSINVNNDTDLIKHQNILNSLEDQDNRFRAIFAVNKLNEGWDVLNLFDIVRLYNTRDVNYRKGKIGATTMAEAQLIGRGARYCPFEFRDISDKYTRKFDDDLTNELRIGEELYYHSQQNSRYIQELTKALEESGIMAKDYATVDLILKDEFKSTNFYKTGAIYVNDRYEIDNSDIFSLDEKLINHIYSVSLNINYFKTEDILAKDLHINTVESENETKIIYLKDLGETVVRKALMKYPTFRFNILKKYFPNVNSITDFINNDNYLGKVKIKLTKPKQKENITNLEKLYIAKSVIHNIEQEIIKVEKRYKGKKEFKPIFVRNSIRDRSLHLSKIVDNGQGMPQSQCDENLKLNLADKEWYVFNENFGTDEEKYFVKYFDSMYDELKKEYSEIFLIRNEKEISIYSFIDGNRFEPDYILVLKKPNKDENVLYQVFIEPKGDQLRKNDSWKEEFLISIASEKKQILKPLFTTEEINIWGLPFYTKKQENDFDNSFRNLLK